MQDHHIYDHYAYQNEYRKRHPEKVLQFRLNTAKNLLEKNGYRVIAPEKQKDAEGSREE